MVLFEFSKYSRDVFTKVKKVSMYSLESALTEGSIRMFHYRRRQDIRRAEERHYGYQDYYDFILYRKGQQHSLMGYCVLTGNLNLIKYFDRLNRGDNISLLSTAVEINNPKIIDYFAQKKGVSSPFSWDFCMISCFNTQNPVMTNYTLNHNPSGTFSDMSSLKDNKYKRYFSKKISKRVNFFGIPF